MLVCKECKGTNIQIRAWVNANNLIYEDSCSDGEIEDNYCNDCNKHTKFEVIEKGAGDDYPVIKND